MEVYSKQLVTMINAQLCQHNYSFEYYLVSGQVMAIYLFQDTKLLEAPVDSFLSCSCSFLLLFLPTIHIVHRNSYFVRFTSVSISSTIKRIQLVPR